MWSCGEKHITRVQKFLVLLVGHAFFAMAAIGIFEWLVHRNSNDFLPPGSLPFAPVDTVLDGDTVVKDGVALHVAGIDAPELGPWAKCWAEAALAGKAKSELEEIMWSRERQWRLGPVSKDQDGRATVTIVDKDGFALAEELVVSGFAAATSQKWNWCGDASGLRSVEEGTKPPHGPNLWWPTGKVYDARAND